MLELMLTRPHEKQDRQAAPTALQFLVLDELHTYRGRQGADVALLVRRVREVAREPPPAMRRHVGHPGRQRHASATSSARSPRSPAGSSARRCKPEHVIGETLRRVTAETRRSTIRPSSPQLDAVVSMTRHEQPPTTYDAFMTDPLAVWIESTFGLAAGAGDRPAAARHADQHHRAGGRGRQAGGADRRARSRSAAAPSSRRCWPAIDVPHPETGFPVFAFRLHQFISRGDTVYASLEAPDRAPHHHPGPAVSCPATGAGSCCPWPSAASAARSTTPCTGMTDAKTGAITYLPREVNDQIRRRRRPPAGFLYARHRQPLAGRSTQEIVERLPEDWLEVYNGAAHQGQEATGPSSLPQPCRSTRWGRKRRLATSITSSSHPSPSA